MQNDNDWQEVLDNARYDKQKEDAILYEWGWYSDIGEDS